MEGALGCIAGTSVKLGYVSGWFVRGWQGWAGSNAAAIYCEPVKSKCVHIGKIRVYAKVSYMYCMVVFWVHPVMVLRDALSCLVC